MRRTLLQFLAITLTAAAPWYLNSRSAASRTAAPVTTAEPLAASPETRTASPTTRTATPPAISPPTLLVAVLSGRANEGRRELMRQNFAAQTRPRLKRGVQRALGARLKVVFVVGRGCPKVARVKPACDRCGLSACTLASTGAEVGPAPDPLDRSLRAEAAKHGDLVLVDSVDEYSRSARKMRAFLLLLGELEADPLTAIAFDYLAKVDDDNPIDVLRIYCALAANDGASHEVCTEAGLVTRLFDAKPCSGGIWWSSFMQNPIQSRSEHAAYYVAPELGRKEGAAKSCVERKKHPGDLGYLSSFARNPATLRPGQVYKPYAYGGSHVLSADIVHHWGAHPELLSTSIWMEDVAFGVWFSRLADKLRPLKSCYVNDQRWLSSQYRGCAAGSLGMNSDGTMALSLSARWLKGLASCGNGCGCDAVKTTVLPPPTVVDAALCG